MSSNATERLEFSSGYVGCNEKDWFPTCQLRHEHGIERTRKLLTVMVEMGMAHCR